MRCPDKIRRGSMWCTMGTNGITPQLSSHPAEASGAWARRSKGVKVISLILGTLIIAAALLLAIEVIRQPWMWNHYIEVPAPPRDISQQEILLREKLNNYEKSAEDLKSLVSLLLGLSSLYALSLGVASYIGVQEAKDRADETVDGLNKLEANAKARVQEYEHRLERQEKEVEKRIETEVLNVHRQFPLFRDMQESIQKIGNNLGQFVPDGDFGRDVFQKIDVKHRVMIEHFERSVAAFEFFDLQPFEKDVSRVYVMLGNYYSHKYAREATENGKDSKENPSPDPADLERATLYLNRAHDVLPHNIAPLNELGYLYVIVTGQNEKAVEFLRTSLKLQSDQQRARHLMAIIEHTGGTEELSKGNSAKALPRFLESVKLLDYAIAKCTRWQTTLEHPRYGRALLYNRACGLARLAELGFETVTNASRAMDDLELVFPAGQEAEEQRVSDLRNDMKDTGDLCILLGIAATRTRLEALIRRVLPTT
jgi:tetratricopeptide (TPR) repeat protein